MEQIEVRTSGEGYVVIEQDDVGGNQPHAIILHPSQIPAVVRWMTEAAKELAS